MCDYDMQVNTHTHTHTHAHKLCLTAIFQEKSWQFGLVVTSLGVSTKLLYVEPG